MSLKSFLREYMFPPVIWSLGSRVWDALSNRKQHLGAGRKPSSKIFGHIPSPIAFETSFREWNGTPPQVLIHGAYEARFGLRLSSESEVVVEENEPGLTHLHLAFCPALPEPAASNLQVFLNGNEIAFLRGALDPNSWTEITAPVASGTSFSIRVVFDGGGEMDMADPRAIVPPNRSHRNVRTHRNILTLLVDSASVYDFAPGRKGVTEQPPTPNIDNFFSDGHRFTNAYSQGHWTLPALASMVTGLYPIQHGVNNPQAFSRQIPHSIPILPELLRKAGYRTMSVSTNRRFSPAYGHNRGHDRFLFMPTQPLRTEAPTVAAAGIEFMEAHRNEPFHCTLHFFDLHYPFAEIGYFPQLQHSGFRWANPDSAYSAWRMDNKEHDPLGGLNGFRNAKIQHLDITLGLIFSYLEKSGLLDDTLVVLTSDHGPRMDHSGTLLMTDDISHVPLLIHVPGTAGMTRDDFVEISVDYCPTILRQAGLDVPTHAVGNDLLSGERRRHEVCISESLYDNSYEIALRDRSWSYFLQCRADPQSGNVILEDARKEFLFRRKDDGNYIANKANHSPSEEIILQKFYGLAHNHIVKRERYFDESCLFNQPHWQ